MFVFRTSHPLFSVQPNSRSQMLFPIYNTFFVTLRGTNYFLILSLYCLLLLLFKSIEDRIFSWYPAMSMKKVYKEVSSFRNLKKKDFFFFFWLKFMVKIIIRSCYTIKTLKEYKCHIKPFENLSGLALLSFFFFFTNFLLHF